MGKKNGYIFTNKQHTQRGIAATILGVISLVTLAYVIVMSYYKKGDVPLQYGTAAFLVMFYSLTGIVISVMSTLERDKYHLFTYLGIGLNVLALIVTSIILYAGAYA